MEVQRNIEKELEEIVKIVPKVRRRSSFFGFESSEALNKVKCEEKSRKIQNNIKFLQQEFKDWPEQYVATRKTLREFWKKNNEAESDESKFTQEQQDFLAGAINVDEYVTKYKEFNNKANVYILKKEWMMKKYNYCVELIQEKIIERQQSVSLELSNIDQLMYTENR